MKRQAAGGQRLDLSVVGVEAENFEPQISQARRMRRTQIPSAENSYLYWH